MFKLSIDKSMIPYRIETILNDKLCYLDVTYNTYDNRVYVSLLDENENEIAQKESIINTSTLFLRYCCDENRIFNDEFPAILMIPNFEDGSTKKITFDNIDECYIYVYEFDRLTLEEINLSEDDYTLEEDEEGENYE